MASGLLKKPTQSLSVDCWARGWKWQLLVKVLGWFSIAAILATVLQADVRADVSPLFVSPPSTNPPPAEPQVSTGWNPSPDPSVTGYYLCWGLATGQCTNFIDVGDVTNATLGGLTTNVEYYFTVVAYDTAGDQAVPSNEIQYMATNQPAGGVPTFTTDLVSQTLAAVGSDVSLQVGATGGDPLTFQWLFNGATLPGETSYVLQLSSVTTADAGQYQVLATDPGGTAASSVTTLTIMAPPAITGDLVDQTVTAGSAATLAVSVTGTGPFTYQWLFNGATLAGASGNPLVLNNAGQQQAGTYQVFVMNPVGTAASSVMNLNVLVPPGIVTDVTSQSAPVGSNVTFQAQVAGSMPLSYQWLFNGTPVPGATDSALVLANVTLAQAGIYWLVATNAAGSIMSAAATLTIQMPPSISVDLTNQTAVIGSSPAFQIQAGGTVPLNYQWFFNGLPLPDATGSALTLTNALLAQAGSYQVTVSNLFGIATSHAVTLTVVQSGLLRIYPFGNNTFRLTFGGMPSLTYELQYSTGLNAQWLTAATAVANPSSGVATYLISPSAPLGWFRVVAQ